MVKGAFTGITTACGMKKPALRHKYLLISRRREGRTRLYSSLHNMPNTFWESTLPCGCVWHKISIWRSLLK
jgi:hypothetical protein